MSTEPSPPASAAPLPAGIRVAGPTDLDAAARLLHRFNLEYDDPSPEPDELAVRLQVLLDAGDAVLLAGEGPDGVAVLRFRPSLWTPRIECYLAELYVAPERRGLGLGRSLLEGSMDLARARGADHLDLCTGEDDTIARGMYERHGLTNRERPGGPLMYYYERDL